MGYKRKPVATDPVTEEEINTEEDILGTEPVQEKSSLVETPKKSSKEYPEEPIGSGTPVDRPAGECCATCIVYKDTDRKHGRCRLKASTKTGFRIVASTHWCEDYKAV